MAQCAFKAGTRKCLSWCCIRWHSPRFPGLSLASTAYAEGHPRWWRPNTLIGHSPSFDDYKYPFLTLFSLEFMHAVFSVFALCLWIWYWDYGLGIIVQGLWFGDCGLGIMVWGLWFGDHGSGIMVRGWCFFVSRWEHITFSVYRVSFGGCRLAGHEVIGFYSLTSLEFAFWYT